MRRVLAVVAFCIAVAVCGSCQTVTQIAVTDASPNGPLVQGNDGNFYGTTYPGGTYADGSAIKVTPDGVVTTLYSFCTLRGWCPDGSAPYAGLVLATDGNFYGTTYGGGQLGCGGTCGTVYRLTPSGTLTTLWAFHGGDGEWPATALIQARDGNLYGTTINGGTHGFGTIFKMTLQGSLTTIYSFCPDYPNCQDGDDPQMPLMQSSDGNLYGATGDGGSYHSGEIYKITPQGVFTAVYAFRGTDGSSPQALIKATDGNLYGATAGGGSNGAGTIFRLSLDGKLTTIYNFSKDQSYGQYPRGQLAQGADPNLYGVTGQGGPWNTGTLFKVTLSGVATTLHAFGNTDKPDAYPRSLMQAKDGNLYGTTAPSPVLGSVFRLWANSHNLAVATHDYSNSFHGYVTSADGMIDCGRFCYDQYKSSDVVTLTATPGDYREAFTDWIGCDSPSDNVCTVKMDKDRQITAEFHPIYSLGIGKYGNGVVVSSDGHINCGNTCSYDHYIDGTLVTLTPTPDPEWAFSEWWGCDSVQSNNNCQVTMKSNDIATVYFVPGHALSVSKSGNGLVTSADGYINCGSACSYSYIVGKSVTLTASPDPNWTFMGWSGCDQTDANICTVTMNSARNVTVTFTPPRQLNVAYTGSGAIASSDGYINCGSSCSHTYRDGTMVNLTASAQQGWGLAGWNGCDRSNLNVCTLGMSSDRAVTATFKVLYGLSVSKSGTGAGAVSSADGHIYCGSLCSYSYVDGTPVTLSAIPSPGNTFTGWAGCDHVNGSYCSVSISGAKNVTATFDAATQITLTSLTLKPTYVKGGQLSAGTVTLSGPAPDGGVSVALASDHPGVAPPGLVCIRAGRQELGAIRGEYFPGEEQHHRHDPRYFRSLPGERDADGGHDLASAVAEIAGRGSCSLSP